MKSKEYILNWFKHNVSFAKKWDIHYYYSDDIDVDHTLYSKVFTLTDMDGWNDILDRLYDLLVDFNSKYKGEFLTFTGTKDLIDESERVSTCIDTMRKIESLPNFRKSYESISQEFIHTTPKVLSDKPYEYRIKYFPITNDFWGTIYIGDGVIPGIVCNENTPIECLEDLIDFHQVRLHYDNK